MTLRLSLLTLLLTLSILSNAQTTIFLEDFESMSLNQMGSSAPTNNLDFKVTNNRGSDPGHSAAYSAYFGDTTGGVFNYNTGAIESASLTSNGINLSGVDWPILKFNYFNIVETDIAKDLFTVLISTDSSVFDTLMYNSLAGGLERNKTWRVAEIDMSNYANQTVYLRFEFNTVDAIDNNYEGIYIDDIEVFEPNHRKSRVAYGTGFGEQIYGGVKAYDGGAIFSASINGNFAWVKIGNNGGLSVLSVSPNGITSSKVEIVQNSDRTYTCAMGRSSNDTRLYRLDSRGRSDFFADPNRSIEQSIADGGYSGQIAPHPDGGTVFTDIDWSSKTMIISRVNDQLDTLWTSHFKNGTSYNNAGSELFVSSTHDIYHFHSVGNTGPYGSNITKFDGLGNLIWSKRIQKSVPAGFLTDDPVSKVIELPNGDLAITGRQSNNTTTLGYQFFVMRMDVNGNVIWAKTFGGANAERPVDMVLTNDNQIAVLAESSSFGLNSNNVFSLFKLDLSGTVQWANWYGGYENDIPVYLEQKPNGDYLMVGTSESYGYGKSIWAVYTNFKGEGVCYAPITATGEAIFAATLLNTTITSEANVINSINANSSAFAILQPILTDNNVPIASLSMDSVSCFGSSDGSIDLSVSSGYVPYTFDWSNGPSTEDNFNLSAGLYSMTLVDNSGCVIIDTITVHEPDDIQINLTPDHVSCFAAADGAIDLNVSGGLGGYNFLWSNAVTTEDNLNLGGGFYQVTVTDTNGCIKQSGVSVFEPSQLFAGISYIKDMSCFGTCDGEIGILSTGGTPPYAYQWNDPSMQTSDTAQNLCATTYLATITDDNGCVTLVNGSINEPDLLQASITTQGSSCGLEDGVAAVSATGGTGTYDYAWSSGGNASTEDSLSVGNYSVLVSDANGCSSTETFSIGSSLDSIPICMITVDSSSTKNVIVWEKPASTNIDGFKIYRNVVGSYSLVGYTPYDSLSQFTDNTGGIDPNITSYRYKITVLDSCGNESDYSDHHETMHLTSNLGTGGQVNLIWDDYEGVPYTFYRILMDTTNNAMVDYYIKDSVPATSFTWTDPTPPSYANYVVEVVLPNSCTSTRANHNTTRSNKTLPSNGGSNSIYSIDPISDYQLYPNPNDGNFKFDYTAVNGGSAHIFITDIKGRLLYETENVTHLGKNSINIQQTSYSNGMYLLHIQMNGYRHTMRFSVVN